MFIFLSNISVRFVFSNKLILIALTKLIELYLLLAIPLLQLNYPLVQLPKHSSYIKIW